MTPSQLAERLSMLKDAAERIAMIPKERTKTGQESRLPRRKVSDKAKRKKAQHKRKWAAWNGAEYSRQRREGRTAEAVRRAFVESGRMAISLRDIEAAMGLDGLHFVRRALEVRGIKIVHTKYGPGLKMTKEIRKWCGFRGWE